MSKASLSSNSFVLWVFVPGFEFPSNSSAADQVILHMHAVFDCCGHKITAHYKLLTWFLYMDNGYMENDHAQLLM